MRKGTGLRVAVVAASVGLLVGGTGTVASAAGPSAATPSTAAAQSCHKHPYQNARTVGIADDRVQLRYSPTCRNAWARYMDTGAGYKFWVYAKPNSRHPKGQTRSQWSGNGKTTRTVYDAGTKAHACVDDYGTKYCTRWY